MAHYDRQGERNENKNDTGRDPGADAAGVRGLASPARPSTSSAELPAAVGVSSQSVRKLWAVYVNTMDDLIAAPSERAACDAAAYFRSRVRDGGFTAIEWPYSAEGHAEQLKDWPKHYPPAADYCPHGRPPHERCDDCAESDAEECAL